MNVATIKTKMSGNALYACASVCIKELICLY
jgi:hypothetical protein